MDILKELQLASKKAPGEETKGSRALYSLFELGGYFIETRKGQEGSEKQ
jgi:hypothetical protein